MIRINIIGAYGEANFGDDLLMCVFENYFLEEFSDIRLNFIGEKSTYVPKLLNNSTYMSPTFSANWNVYGGGTQFFAFKKEETSLLKKLSYVLSNPSILLKKIMKATQQKDTINSKVAFLGIGLGPFHNNSNVKEYAKHTLTKGDFVGVRDEVSLGFCKEWDIKAVLGADVVYSRYFRLPELKQIRKGAKKKIGIIVRDWTWEATGHAYIEKLKDFYRDYSESEMKFIIFSPQKDKEWMRTVKGNDALVWDPDKYTVNQFLNELNTFDVFITARYHGAIIASLLSKPVISVEIEPKLKILTEQVKEIKLWKKPFDTKELVDLLKRVDYEVDFSLSIQERRKRADSMLDAFKGYLK